MDPTKPSNTESQTQTLPEEQNPVESDDSTMPRSRINKSMENQAKKNILLTIVGMAVIIGILWYYGVPALQKLSDFTVNNKDKNDTPQKTEIAPLLAPTLNVPFEATKSAEINVTGSAEDGDEVKLYVNDSFTDKVKIKDDKTFTFDDVTLKEGMNTLKAKVTKSDKESNFSDGIQIAYYSKDPALDISSPVDGGVFNHDHNPIKVSGKTDSQATVSVNDHRAIMETDGNFEYTLTLHDGDNDIKITASDQAGNQTEKHVKATLQ